MYTTPVKEAHRASLAAMIKDSSAPMLYLDDESAGATDSFLHQHGVPKARLRPVNWSAPACASIHRKTGVRAECADIYDVVQREDAEYSMIWFDLLSTTVDASALKVALQISTYVAVTLSTRQHGGANASLACKKLVERCKGRIVNGPCPYAGKSGVATMITFVATKKATRPAPPPPLVGRTVRVPATAATRRAMAARVRIEGKSLCYKVTGTYYRRRFVVQALRPDGRSVEPHKETWVLTAEEVERMSS